MSLMSIACDRGVTQALWLSGINGQSSIPCARKQPLRALSCAATVWPLGEGLALGDEQMRAGVPGKEWVPRERSGGQGGAALDH